jgi:hypothetical protein
MNVSPQLIELILGTILAIQGWALLEIIRLRSKVEILETIVVLQTNKQRQTA